MTTFRVDDVRPPTEPLPTRRLADVYDDVLALGGDPDTPLIEPDGVHPLLDAVSRAFADHRTLVLSPDAIWLTIAQGVAQHVRLNAEELRPKLVGHAGREALTLSVPSLPADPEVWHDLIEEFGKEVASRAAGADLFECDFTTSTSVERTAGRIVLLDGYSPYFSYWLKFVCGIPRITLTGTVEDWRKIRSKMDRLPEFGLEKWVRSLAPIADEFVRAADGDPNLWFWQRIYNPADAYGGKLITGWIARFYPYLRYNGVADNPNPLLDLPIGEPRNVVVDRHGGADCPSIRTDYVPATLSQAVVRINNPVARENKSVALHAGLVGVTQSPNWELKPIAGWYVTEATPEMGPVLDRILREHETTPAVRPPVEARLWTASAEVVELYERIGSATAVDGRWRIVPLAEYRRAYDVDARPGLAGFVELADGRHIAMVFGSQGFHWVLCRFEPADLPLEVAGQARRCRLAGSRSDMPVLGDSLAVILDVILDGDDPARLETCRLSELDVRNSWGE
ncbi:DUF4419 domain-containing protein [Kutzneria buriramensis]|uniref:Uncharacterized protein DUF4419 n=1 Tax=Kutzneria buriramensis TaxID=1045776 RepID=A0A3E0HH06_9PSEU|nr:DUF4419 domain-containing protein [Kutzneria buriramensis]REH44807.1 uncharacterized protein DUF4419 [Kutzneria buriramensis]